MPAALFVDLTAELPRKSPVPEGRTSESPPAEAPKAAEKPVPPEDTVIADEKEPEKPTAEETRHEAPPAPAPKADEQISSEQQVPGQDALLFARAHHLAILHARTLSERTGESIRSHVDGTLAVDKRVEMQGAFAEVFVSFNDDGSFRNAEVAANSPDLLQALQSFHWPSVPSPADFRLRSRVIFVKVIMDQGLPRVFVRLL